MTRDSTQYKTNLDFMRFYGMLFHRIPRRKMTTCNRRLRVLFLLFTKPKRAAPWRGPQNKRGVRSAVHLAHRARGVVLPDDAVDLLEIGRRQIARHCVFDAGCGVTELHGFLRIAVF